MSQRVGLLGLLLVLAACSAPAESATTTTTITVPETTTAQTATTVTTEATTVWPPRLIAPSLIHDQAANALVLFGGISGRSNLGTFRTNQTWILDLNQVTWSSADSSIRPPSRSRAPLAYDEQSQLVVMIGTGDRPQPPQLNTWVFETDQRSWELAGRGPVSLERQEREHITGGFVAPVIAYDAESDRTVLFGGGLLRGDPGDPLVRKEFQLDETWTYDPNTSTWENMRADPNPGPQDGGGMVYDPASDRTILVTETGEIWKYDYNTNSWSPQSESSGPRPTEFSSQLVFDTESNRLVMIRDIAEVWAYEPLANEWTRQPATPIRPINTAMSATAYLGKPTDRIALYGGCIENVDPFTITDYPTQCSNELWFYDLNTNTWEKIGPPDR